MSYWFTEASDAVGVKQELVALHSWKEGQGRPSHEGHLGVDLHGSATSHMGYWVPEIKLLCIEMCCKYILGTGFWKFSRKNVKYLITKLLYFACSGLIGYIIKIIFTFFLPFLLEYLKLHIWLATCLLGSADVGHEVHKSYMDVHHFVSLKCYLFEGSACHIGS